MVTNSRACGLCGVNVALLGWQFHKYLSPRGGILPASESTVFAVKGLYLGLIEVVYSADEAIELSAPFQG
jgi:hypothetical protein